MMATLGAATGAIGWMSLLMFLTSKVKQAVNSKILSRLVIGSGVLLLLFAVYMIITVIIDVARG